MHKVYSLDCPGHDDNVPSGAPFGPGTRRRPFGAHCFIYFEYAKYANAATSPTYTIFMNPMALKVSFNFSSRLRYQNERTKRPLEQQWYETLRLKKKLNN